MGVLRAALRLAGLRWMLLGAGDESLAPDVYGAVGPMSSGPHPSEAVSPHRVEEVR